MNARLPLRIATTLTLALSLTACGNDAVTDVSLAELAARAPAYDGRTVRTRGIVRGFHDPRHYWLEDEHVNRVGLFPLEHIAPHLDRRVTVTGRFSYSRERGRGIVIEHIDVHDSPR